MPDKEKRQKAIQFVGIFTKIMVTISTTIGYFAFITQATKA